MRGSQAMPMSPIKRISTEKKMSATSREMDPTEPDEERSTSVPIATGDSLSLVHQTTYLGDERSEAVDVMDPPPGGGLTELAESENVTERGEVGGTRGPLADAENDATVRETPITTAGPTSADRAVSVASARADSQDLPTPDYDQLMRQSSSSPAETEVDRSRSKLLESAKSAGSAQRDGRKSVTFADVPKDTEDERPAELPGDVEEASEKGELFSTAVSEEKIQEAVTRKFIRAGISDPPGNTTLLSEQAACYPGSDILSQRANEHYDRGCHLSDDGEFAAAITAFNKAINLCPNEVVFYLMRGEVYLEMTDFQSAIQNLKKVCVLQPASEIHYSKLAFVYYLQGQSLFDQCLYNEALESFSRAAEMRPENIGYQTRSMACLAAMERHGECLALVNKKIEEDQSTPDLYIMRARLHLIFRNFSLCYYDVKDALALDPDHVEARKLLQEQERRAREGRDGAVRLQLQGKLRESLQGISRAIEMNPSIAEFNLLRGAIHRRLHDFYSAIDDFLLALDKTDHDESDRVYVDAQRQLLLTYNDFAVDCFLGGHFDEAILLLNKAIKQEKKEKGLYVNRGDCFFRLGELHFSLADYHQALELDPRDLLVRGRIAAIHGEFGSVDYEEHSYQDAEARFTVAIQHNPRNSRYYLSRAKVRFMLEESLVAASKKPPQLWEIDLRRVTGLHNHAGARQDILISLHLDPTNDAIHSLLARLFPGKTVGEVMKTRAAKEANIVLDNAVIIASPVKLPDIAVRLARREPVQSSNKEEAGPPAPAAAAPLPAITLVMTENDFNKMLAKKKKMISTDVKSSIQDRLSLKKTGPRLKPQPPPKDCELRGGHWKMEETKPPLGWRQFGLGIEMKDAR